MEVIKRNGLKEPVFFDKITKRLRNLLNKGNQKVLVIDPTIIAQQVIKNLYDGITTTELDNLAARVCAAYSSDNPDYDDLGGRICMSSLHKITPNKFSEFINLAKNNKDKNNIINSLISDELYEVVQKNKDLIDNKINDNNDFLINYFGFKTLERAYLFKSNNTIIERPQYLWMRVAIGIHGGNLEDAFKTYELMSQKYFTHASPTLFNCGTNRPQLSSCFLIGTEDSIEGIFKTISNVAYISKNAGGIGVHISNIRANGSLIRKTNGTSNGIIPMLQVYNYVARYIDQGGKRSGAFAMYIEPWHYDIFEFLELRKNTGSETDRARDLFLAIWMCDMFIKKVINDEDWYLMCPDESTDLNNVWGDEFDKLYNNYVESGKFKKKVKARYLWNKILESQVETGTPYILFKDNINRKSNQKNIGIIKSSNLCAEIVEYSDEKETAVCNLASIALNSFVEEKIITTKDIKIYSKNNCVYCKLAKMLLKNKQLEYEEIILEDDEKIGNKINICKEGVCGKLNSVPQILIDGNLIGGYNELKEYLKPEYNFDKLKEVSKVICKNLNKIIDINYYPIPEAKLSNFKHRPIGIGVQGLSDTYMLMRYPFESEEANQLNEQIFETIYYGSLEASMELSKERGEKIEEYLKSGQDIYKSDLAYDINGSYEYFTQDINRPHAKGAYHSFIGSPFSKGLLQFDLWDKKPSNKWDWDKLKEDIIKFGTRNSLLTALMPTASTSQILGNNECFEPLTNNIGLRKTQAGEFKLINKYLIQDLKNLNLWDKNMKNRIILDNGSIQNIDIPDELKNLYKIVWEIKQKSLLIQAASRGPYIDQTQSMNIFMEDANFNKMTSCYLAAWKLGLKTGVYYFRTKPAANAIKFTVNNEECTSCSA